MVSDPDEPLPNVATPSDFQEKMAVIGSVLRNHHSSPAMRDLIAKAYTEVGATRYATNWMRLRTIHRQDKEVFARLVVSAKLMQRTT